MIGEALTAYALVSMRSGWNVDLRDSAADGMDRMLIAVEPGTEIPIHKHSTICCPERKGALHDLS